MTSPITATMILDSVNPDGCRISTISVVMPKFLVAQLNTHRKFSRNSASSRAITIAKNIGYVLNLPVTPADYGMPANGSGMQPKATLSPLKAFLAKTLWNGAKYSAITFAYLLSKVGLHKQWVNRLLEPFVYTTVLITSTEWRNFLTLRMHGAAQDAMQHVAYHINRALISSTPVRLEWGGWHLPYVGQFIKDDPTESQQNVSVSCCAQVSFRSNDDSVEKAERVVKALSGDPPHASPFEHAAQAVCEAQYGNLDEGWVSLRYSRFGY